MGKLDKASRKGGMLSSRSVPLPGLIDLMPTIMIGTILPSLSSSSPLFSPRPSRDAESASAWSLLVEEPNLNILKKFKGCAFPPGVSAPSSVPL